jgi:hypothetical protein
VEVTRGAPVSRQFHRGRRASVEHSERRGWVRVQAGDCGARPYIEMRISRSPSRAQTHWRDPTPMRAPAMRALASSSAAAKYRLDHWERVDGPAAQNISRTDLSPGWLHAPCAHNIRQRECDALHAAVPPDLQQR